MLPTPEQKRIIDHDPSKNGRVLAGPGTGKSSTCVALVSHLSRTQQGLNVRLLTFTRAATQELARKVVKEELATMRPTTVHSFALSLLLRNPQATNLPRPIRIPDSWELGQIRSDLARLLRGSTQRLLATPPTRSRCPKLPALHWWLGIRRQHSTATSSPSVK